MQVFIADKYVDTTYHRYNALPKHYAKQLNATKNWPHIYKCVINIQVFIIDKYIDKSNHRYNAIHKYYTKQLNKTKNCYACI